MPVSVRPWPPRSATGEHRTDVESHSGLDAVLVVEVLAGSGGHGTLTVVRIR
ncbi:hypothetical protein [Streptomyces anulatus]|uniref:hypothetical protein n=1 Tax=Streptomyces anulatus TaxID=1892 RepID=UPI0037DD9189